MMHPVDPDRFPAFAQLYAVRRVHDDVVLFLQWLANNGYAILDKEGEVPDVQVMVLGFLQVDRKQLMKEYQELDQKAAEIGGQILDDLFRKDG